MKILFLVPPPLDGHPPAERIFGCNYGIYPQNNIFILYPATILKKEGYEVVCEDFSFSYRGRFKFLEFIERNFFDIVVFYTVFLSKKSDLNARDKIKKINLKARYIFISTEPTASPLDFLDGDSVVIRGEAESRISAVVKALGGGKPLLEIPGVSFVQRGEIIHTSGGQIIEDIDSIPFPDRTLFEADNYYNPKLRLRPFTTMITSRGCSFNCYYCVPNSLDFAREIEYKRNNNMRKPPVRLRSPQNIIAECQMLAGSGYRAVSFIDDQFVWGDSRTIEICEGLKDLGFEWSCLARADMLQNEAVISSMATCGCKLVAIGIESFNQKILDYIGKGCRVEVFYSAIKKLKKYGISTELNILLGSSPFETKETIRQTFQEVLRLDPEYALFSICTPFPFTIFNEKAKKEGWMVRPEYEAVDPIRESFISYPHLSKEELENTVRRLYLSYYFRPGFLLKKTAEITSWRDFKNKIKAALAILR